MILKIKVTQDHIKRATRCNSQDCAIYHAVNDVLHLNKKFAVLSNEIHLYKEEQIIFKEKDYTQEELDSIKNVSINLPSNASLFIKDFDNYYVSEITGEPLAQPFEFNIELNEEAQRLLFGDKPLAEIFQILQNTNLEIINNDKI